MGVQIAGGEALLKRFWSEETKEYKMSISEYNKSEALQNQIIKLMKTPEDTQYGRQVWVMRVLPSKEIVVYRTPDTRLVRE